MSRARKSSLMRPRLASFKRTAQTLFQSIVVRQLSVVLSVLGENCSGLKRSKQLLWENICFTIVRNQWRHLMVGDNQGYGSPLTLLVASQTAEHKTNLPRFSPTLFMDVSKLHLTFWNGCIKLSNLHFPQDWSSLDSNVCHRCRAKQRGGHSYSSKATAS